jgi:hypothetical protein
MAKIRAGADSVPAFSKMNIDLPDLAEPSGIQPANILALQPIYVAAQLEQLKIFLVVDRLVELAQNGMLPLGGSGPRRMLDDYSKNSGTRMTAAERRNVYARAFGVDTSGTSSPTVNRDFDGLWARFVSAVSAWVRQLNCGKPSASAQITVKKRARAGREPFAARLWRRLLCSVRAADADERHHGDLISSGDQIGLRCL